MVSVLKLMGNKTEQCGLFSLMSQRETFTICCCNYLITIIERFKFVLQTETSKEEMRLLQLGSQFLALTVSLCVLLPVLVLSITAPLFFSPRSNVMTWASWPT